MVVTTKELKNATGNCVDFEPRTKPDPKPSLWQQVKEFFNG